MRLRNPGTCVRGRERAAEGAAYDVAANIGGDSASTSTHGSNGHESYDSSSSPDAPTSTLFLEDALDSGMPWVAEGDNCSEWYDSSSSSSPDAPAREENWTPWLADGEADSSPDSSPHSSDGTRTWFLEDASDGGMPWNETNGTHSESTWHREGEGKSNALESWIPDLLFDAQTERWADPIVSLAAYPPMLRNPLQPPTVQTDFGTASPLPAGSATSESCDRTVPMSRATDAASTEGGDARVSQLVQQALREKIVAWADVDLLLQSDPYSFQPRPAVVPPDVK